MSTPAPDAAGSLAAARLLVADAAAVGVDHEPLAPDAVLAGTPTAGTAVLLEGARGEVGVWELTPGTVTDVEVEELFVVLSGRGRVELADGSVVPLRPGAVVRLHAGDRTRWVVEETLRKVYVAPAG